MNKFSLSRLSLFPLCALFFTGCGGDSDNTESNVPSIASRTSTAGELSKEQRGVSIDTFDLAVLRNDLSSADINDNFGVLVINVSFIEGRGRCDQTSCCGDPSRFLGLQPAEAVAERLAELDSAGIDTSKVAVNVDLLTPKRDQIHYVCSEDIVGAAGYNSVAVRENVVEAFRALAANERIDYITVGLDMNRYHGAMSDQTPTGDYANWISLYREIYTNIKRARNDIKVGPGVSYDYFRARTMPAVAETEGLADPGGLEAAYIAYQRTIRPLLVDLISPTDDATADYLAVSMVPFVDEPPFAQGLNPEDPDEAAALQEYYTALGMFFVERELPLVIPQADWPQGRNARPRKADFLKRLKVVASGYTLEWFSWRRFSDIPDPASASDCDGFTETQPATMAYGNDYCGSGLVNEYGRVTDDDRVYRDFIGQ